MILFKDKDLIKVVTGIRRSGKSTLLDLYIDYLLHNGVEQGQIIRINFEDADFSDLLDYKKLYDYVNGKLTEGKRTYVFFDEIQNVHDFQKDVDSLYIKKNCDISITGSNAYLLSGELATLLSGRYVEIKVQPFSFAEYVAAKGGRTELAKKYQDYIENGSFPYTVYLNTQKDIRVYLEGVYNTVLLKDIVARNSISDITLLQDVIAFVFDSIGNPLSATSIAHTLTSKGRKTSFHTVETYLENIVYLELIRRGYEVYIGKNGDAEIDFIAVSSGDEEYYQVAYTVIDDATLERELRPLESLKNHNAKFLLTMDYETVSHNGIKQLNVLEWLLAK